MSKKKKDIKLALLIEEMLDYVPTDLKYNKTLEKFLLKTLGHGIIKNEDLKSYEQIEETTVFEKPLSNNIPNNITEEELAIIEAEKILYDATKKDLKDIYPEAFSETESKKYIKTKKN